MTQIGFSADVLYPNISEVTDTQPRPMTSIELPVISNAPSDLSVLTLVDHLFVKQKVELLEAFTGFETNNEYSVLNPATGEQLFHAKEENDCCTRNCCGKLRPFEMKVFHPHTQQEVIHITRPLRCDIESCICCPCKLQEMEISLPNGVLLGSLKQNFSWFYPNFSVLNEVGEVVLKIKGPFVKCSCGKDVEFRVTTVEGNEIGKISKKWSGFAKEAFTDADNFGMQFPMDLDVKMKAVLLGACFLIDFIFFEDSGNNNTISII